MDDTVSAADRDRRIDGFKGRVVSLGDAGYAAARAIWNGQVDRRPRLIARCADEADVQTALRFARHADMPVAVRGGGHNVAGHALCEGGLVIDLSALRGVTVDPATGRAVVQGGARLGDVDHATVPGGRLVPAGIVTDTGIGGLTLGGGVGWAMRRHGLTCDSLVAVDMVAADGSARRVDERNDPELLWGLRGGGGNFGVVTRFHFRTHRIDPVVAAGFVVYRLDEPGVLRRLAAYLVDAPRDVTTITFLRLAPPLPWMPDEVIGTPIADTVAPRPFVDHQAVIDAANPSGHRYYWSSRYIAVLDDRVLDRLVDHAHRLSAPGSLVALFQLGGAVPDGATGSCVPYRSASFLVTYGSHWLDPAEDAHHGAWTRAVVGEIATFGAGGGYANFDGDPTATAARIFPPETLRRLMALKRIHDPDNVLRHNVNITPDVSHRLRA